MIPLGVLGSSRVAGGGWSPADLPGVQLWLDASDTSSITASGGAVSAWASQVGSYSAAQATSGKRPTTGTTSLNSLNVLSFDGGDAIVVPSVNLSTTDAVSVWFVGTGAGVQYDIFMEHGNDTTNGFLLYRRADRIDFTARGSGGYSAFFHSTPYGAATPRVITGVTNRALSTNETTAWQDGTSAGSREPNANSSGNFNTLDLFIGARNQSTLYMTGYIADMGVCAGAMSDTDRESLEGYLAHKWGLAGNLPSGHPYKSAPPT